MSHEIRTPIHNVLGMLDLIAAADLDEEHSRLVDTAIDAASALVAILNDALDLSKIEAGELRLDPAPFRLRPLLESTIESFAAAARKNNIGIDAVVGDDVPDSVVADAGRLRQVLVNLIGNAVRFTEEGGIRLLVSRVDAEDRSLVQFRVEDSGIGIPQERHASIFAAFQQADRSTSRRYGGTGLGLAISAELTRLLGGTIWVESDPGHGSAFSFTARLDPAELPTDAGDDVTRGALRAAKSVEAAGAALGACPSTPSESSNGLLAPVFALAAQAGACQAVRDATVTRYSDKLLGRDRRTDTAVAFGAPLRVLVADDDSFGAAFVSALLDRWGHRHTLATDGAEALVLAAENEYDVILMDVEMPALGGVDALARLRTTLGPNETTPVVALTAHAFAGDTLRLRAQGFMAVLTKPFRPEQLAEMLRAAARRGNRRPLGTLESTTVPRRGSHDATEHAGSPTEPSVDCPVDVVSLVGIFGGYLEHALPTAVAAFQPVAPKLLASLQDALDRSDAPLAARTAHTLAGSTAQLGLAIAAQEARACEHSVRSSDWDAARARASRLRLHVQAALAFFDRGDWEEEIRARRERTPSPVP